MEPPTDFRKLTDDDWRELQERADRFAEALRRGGEVDWQEHLAGLSGNLRNCVLHEFIKIDLEAAWKSGRRAFLDEYLRKFPELGSPYDLPAHLVYEEFRIRSTLGDKPEPDSYLTRFPHIAETLRGLFQTGSQTRQDKAHLETLTPAAVDRSVVIPKETNPESMLTAVGQYEMLELLGRGQFGEVWRAKAPGGVEVAVKVISQPADRESAKRELQALELVKNLRHPCLMATLAFWEHQNKIYIVVELADGTLRDRMKECKQEGQEGVAAEELLRYFASAAEGLDFLHAKRVFHRDIKPDNILIINGHAKLADFGLARAGDRPDLSVSFAGTPVYMAPEVWGGKFKPQSDLYSLAMTYAELRLGRRPLDGKDFVELMSQQLDKAPDLKGLPPGETAVLTRALSKQPEKRHSSCKVFVEDLRVAVVQDGHPITRPRAVPIWAVILGVVLLVGTGAGVWALLNGNGSQPTGNGTASLPPPPTTTTKPPPTKSTPDNNTAKDPNTPQETWPDKYRAVQGAQITDIGTKRYADRIEGKEEFSGVTPTFIKVAVSENKWLYVMETKVWNGLMAAFRKSPDGAKWSGTLSPGTPTAAAMGMTFEEAAACANWLGGRLPTPDEWDTAAGYPPKGNVPLLTEGKPGVGLKAPRSVKDPHPDKVSTGVLDMLGNGREWTSRKVQVRGDGGADFMVLRGRMFTLDEPLQAKHLLYEQTIPQTQLAGKGSPYTGFRVVIDPK